MEKTSAERVITKKKTIFHRWINGTKGVISLFLAILMVPFVTIAGSLINAARINSAVAVFDEALCNASNSTLGTYDSFLKKRFGLLAMSQDTSSSGAGLSAYTVSNLISDTFAYYMEQNLKTLSNTYITAESQSTGVYPLSNTDVLYTQILEYSKYTVPTQLVIDGFSLNDLIAKLEKSLPGQNMLNMITSGAKVADSMVTLAEDFELLKDAVSEQETAETNYTNAYTSFSNAVSSYRTKKSEMNTTLANLQTTIDTERSKITSYANEVDRLEAQIKNYQDRQKETGEDYSNRIEAKKAELKQYREDNAETLKPWEDAKTNYSTTKASYESTLKSLQQTVVTKKSEYSGKISTLVGKLKTTKEKLTTVQSDILAMGNSVANMTTTAVSSAISEQKSKNNATIEKNNKLIAESNDAQEKAKLQAENEALRKANNNLDNQSAVTKAQKTGFETATQTMKERISKINTEEYTTQVNALTSLKGTVDAYDTTTISSVSKSQYYVTLAKILTSTQVEEAEKAMVAECAGEAIWSLISSLIGFIEALFSAASVYDPNLKAVIDMTYYKDTYGGLPGTKNRTTYPLSMGEAGDAELSEYYKELIGGFSGDGSAGTGGMDVIAKLMSIFSSLGTISTNVTAIIGIVGLFNLAERLKKIMDAIDSIGQNLKDIISYFGNLLSETAIGGRMMLTGYVSYMTSNRTTYKKSALTGSSFNMRGQIVPSGFKAGGLSGFMALIDTIQKVAEGGEEKCFYGAETEYIIFGSTSEIANQAAAFAVTYGIRILANIAPVLSNPEVQSIAAACTIGAPLVNLLYILIEPLVDTIILVNGGKLQIIKNMVYLTPSGLLPLIQKFTSLRLSTAQLNSVKTGFLDGLGATKYADQYAAFGDGSTNADDSSLLDIDYSQNLFLIMVITSNPETMLKRMSNIIEMEAVEYMNNKGMGSNGLFDLDYSYTFIRTEASFTTNEFISISDGTGLNAKERIIYRGY